MPLPKWFRLGFPGACIALGTWQLCRWHRKEKMIKEWQDSFASEPKVVAGINEIDPERSRRYLLKGSVDLKRAKWIGPRAHNKRYEYIVVAPLELKDHSRVLMNLGWSLKEGSFPSFDERTCWMIDKTSESTAWFNQSMPVKNIESLAGEMHTLKLMLKQVDSAVPYSNRHLEYIATWYSVALCSYLFGHLFK